MESKLNKIDQKVFLFRFWEKSLGCESKKKRKQKKNLQKTKLTKFKQNTFEILKCDGSAFIFKEHT